MNNFKNQLMILIYHVNLGYKEQFTLLNEPLR